VARALKRTLIWKIKKKHFDYINKYYIYFEAGYCFIVTENYWFCNLLFVTSNSIGTQIKNWFGNIEKQFKMLIFSTFIFLRKKINNNKIEGIFFILIKMTRALL